MKDSEIIELIKQEEERQQNEICLIASENVPDSDVYEACGSVLQNKYTEGYPNKRYYGGCQIIDKIEQLAIDRAKKLFEAEHANVQPHDGSGANMSAYMAVLKPGDTILAPSLQSGGHLTHSASVSFVSKIFNVVSYDVSKETFLFDYDNIEQLTIEHKPKLIVCGYSAYSRLLDYKRFREIADKVGAYLMCDMAHFAGLVAAKVIPSPVPYCDIVTSTVQKTLKSGRGGLILCKKELAKAVDKAVFPATQGGALQNMIAGKAVGFGLALQSDFKKYGQQVLSNAKVLSEQLQIRGIKILTGGTDNHLMVVDLRGTGVTGVELEQALEMVGITTNKNSIPFDTEKPMVTSGIRLGTPNVTSRGMKGKEMCEIADMIYKVFAELKTNHSISQEHASILKERVKQLTKDFPINKGE